MLDVRIYLKLFILLRLETDDNVLAELYLLVLLTFTPRRVRISFDSVKLEAIPPGAVQGLGSVPRGFHVVATGNWVRDGHCSFQVNIDFSLRAEPHGGYSLSSSGCVHPDVAVRVKECAHFCSWYTRFPVPTCAVGHI